MPIVSLLTDFGVTDTYVGQMKAAILRVAPSASLVDLTHEVPAQDVRAGAFLLWTAVEAFPRGSLHLAVVDPGVGSRAPNRLKYLVSRFEQSPPALNPLKGTLSARSGRTCMAV
jgi:S-adenosylmethionine hydrolase